MENMTKKVKQMKNGSSVTLDSESEVRSFRAICYRFNKKPVSRKTHNNKFKVKVYDNAPASEVSA